MTFQNECGEYLKTSTIFPNQCNASASWNSETVSELEYFDHNSVLFPMTMKLTVDGLSQHRSIESVRSSRIILQDKFAIDVATVVYSVHLTKRECRENDSNHSAIVVRQSKADLMGSMVVRKEESIAFGQISRSY